MNTKNRDFDASKVITCIGIFALVWFQGGEQLWQFAIFSIFVIVSSIINVLSIDDRGINNIKMLKIPMCIASLFLLYLILYLAPLPSSLLELTAEGFDTGNLNKSVIPSTYTVSPFLTSVAIFKYIIYALFFLNLFHLYKQLEELISFLRYIYACGCLFALYSLINHVSDGGYELFPALEPWGTDWSETIRGTFSYKNHFAAFLHLLIPIGFYLAYLEFKYYKVEGDRVAFNKGMLIVINQIFFVYLVIASGSKGGFLLLVAFPLLILSLCVIKKLVNSRLQLWIKTLLVVSILTASMLLSSSALNYSQGEQSLSNGRDFMYTSMTSIIAERPIFGTGPGTYEIYQNKYKDKRLTISRKSIRAHNEYLELLTNIGIVGCFLVACLFVSLLNVKAKVHGEKHSIAHYCSEGALLIILIYATFDFVLQLPAIMVLVLSMMVMYIRSGIDPVNKSIGLSRN
ncbi:O-antigen ligase family protein [Ningiella sp. W23]|uniref:O-antigen ligase family protein n=1 Tax=Ningiella sp. W23 TaxID=3023715 RepID=UPI0037581FF3